MEFHFASKVYFNDNKFNELKIQLEKQLDNLGKNEFRAKINKYFQGIKNNDGFDVVVYEFAIGIINEKYDFCFVRLFKDLCAIFELSPEISI